MWTHARDISLREAWHDRCDCHIVRFNHSLNMQYVIYVILRFNALWYIACVILNITFSYTQRNRWTICGFHFHPLHRLQSTCNDIHHLLTHKICGYLWHKYDCPHPLEKVAEMNHECLLLHLHVTPKWHILSMHLPCLTCVEDGYIIWIDPLLGNPSLKILDLWQSYIHNKKLRIMCHSLQTRGL